MEGDGKAPRPARETGTRWPLGPAGASSPGAGKVPGWNCLWRPCWRPGGSEAMASLWTRAGSRSVYSSSLPIFKLGC